MTVQQVSAGRHYGMDWLRIGAFALLIFYHVGMVFVPWDFHISLSRPIDWATIPMLALNPWRMSLLFVVSGFASHALMGKTSDPGAFLAARTSRLIAPLVFGMAVIVPPQSWVELTVKHGYGFSYLHFLAHDYFRFGALDGIILPTWNHLWFLAYLWTYTLLLGLALLILPARLREASRRVTTRLLSGGRIVLLPLAWLASVQFVLLPHRQETHALVGDWYAHAHYLPAFLFGFLLAASPELWASIRRWAAPAAIAALVCYAAVATVEWTYPGLARPTPLMAYAFLAARAAMRWLAIVALLGLADRALNRDHRLRPMLTEAVFPLYLIHQTIIVLAAWALLRAGTAPLALFVLLVLVTAAGSWAFYLAGRSIGWLRPWIGLRPLPRRRRRRGRGGSGLNRLRAGEDGLARPSRRIGSLQREKQRGVDHRREAGRASEERLATRAVEKRLQHHSFSLSFFGRPRGRCSGAATFIPRRASASRSSTSISALTLRKSAAAARSSAAHRAGSTRSG